MPNPGTLALPNPARFEPVGAVVRDMVTELVWSVAFSELVTFDAARAFCASLDDGGTPGGSTTRSEDGAGGFRLPTRIELVSLLDRTRTPAVDERVFGSVPQDYFWTASPLPGEPALRYSVYFGAGETSSGVTDQASAYTRCVRGGRRALAPRYEAEDDLVTDRATGLVWQRAASREPLSLDTARRFCAGSEPAGFFRLPSEKELQTLVTTSAAGAALIDDAAFPSTPAETFWTAVFDPVPAMSVDFATGFALVNDAAGTHHVRCVR